MTKELLLNLGCDYLVDSLSAWKGPGPSPHDVKYLQSFCKLDMKDTIKLVKSHELFKQQLSSLTKNERSLLHSHIIESFWNVQLRSESSYPRADVVANIISGLGHAPGSSLLDVGSSHGLHGLLHLMLRHNLPLTFAASDILACNIRLLALLGLDTFALNCEHASCSKVDTVYDIVMCNEVLEHIDQTSEDALLFEMRRWTKPGGSVVISFPEDANPQAYDIERDPLGHVRQPSPIKICAAFTTVLRNDVIRLKQPTRFIVGKF
mgnify:CR=1 FL=1